ncbi:hypothetical protein EV673_1524 [Limnobacter thiooxidans]|nr:hypothetical protein EV673_1524 [Limnobacter thiooxidans]
MALRGPCCLCKLEGALRLRLAACDLRPATCDLQPAVFLESPAFLQRKFAACEVFVCCIILPIRGRASRLIRSEGRLRKQSMRRRHAFRIPQARINKTGNQACPRQDELQRTPKRACATKRLSETCFAIQTPPSTRSTESQTRPLRCSGFPCPMGT